jgi:hypothetical protein
MRNAQEKAQRPHAGLRRIYKVERDPDVIQPDPRLGEGRKSITLRPCKVVGG